MEQNVLKYLHIQIVNCFFTWPSQKGTKCIQLKRNIRKVTLTGLSTLPSVLLEAAFRTHSVIQIKPAHNFGGRQFIQVR